jgi:hypothetical protein
MGNLLTEKEKDLLMEALKYPLKPLDVVLDVTDLNAHKLGAVFNDSFLDLYRVLRNKEIHLDKEALSQAIHRFNGLTFDKDQDVVLMLDTLESMLEEALKEGSEEKALAGILVKSLLKYPENFPLNLDPLRTLDRSNKYLWMQKQIVEPLQLTIHADALLRKSVHGISTHFPVVSQPISVEKPNLFSPVSPFPFSPVSPFYEIPSLSLSMFTLKRSLPSTEVVEKDKRNRSEVLDFLQQPLKGTVAKNALKSLHEQAVNYYSSEETLKQTYTIQNQKTFDTAVEALKEKSQKIALALEGKQQAIEAFANKLSEDPVQNDIIQARLLTGEMQSLTFRDCLVLFLKKDPKQVRALNPALSDEDIQNLFTQVRDFLVEASNQQHLENVIALSKNPEKLSVMAEEIEKVRFYDVNKHPDYLLIEYATGFWLRPSQVESLDTLFKEGYHARQEIVSKVLELGMGAGKTEIIFPIISHLLADGHRLAVTMLPQEFIPSMAEAYKAQLSASFDKVVFQFEFNINSPADSQSLSYLLKSFERAIDDQRIVLMSSESLSALFLKFTQRLSEMFSKKHPFSVEELDLFKKIFTLFKERSGIAIDEVADVLNAMKTDHVTVDNSSWLKDVNPVIGQTVIDFLRFLENNPELHQGMQLDASSPVGSLPFLENIYHEKVKEGLILGILDGKFQTRGNFAGFMKGLKAQQIEWVEKYLQGERGPEILAFTDTLSHERQDILAILSDTINKILPFTATKRLYQHFGLEILKDGTEGPMAAPRDKGKVAPTGTQFSQELVRLILTARVYRENKISEAFVKKIILDLKQEVQHQIQTNGVGLQETKEYAEFKELVGDLPYDLLTITDQDFAPITKRLNSQSSYIFDFIENHVFSKAEVFPRQLNSDAQLPGILASMILGMTGTAWNTDTMTNLITFVQHSSTAAKTLHIQFKNTPKKVDVIPTPNATTNVKDLINELQKNSEEPTSIIDVGNVLRGQDPVEVAQALLKVAEEKGWNQKGVGTYSDKGERITISSEGVAKDPKGKLTTDQHLFVWPLVFTTGSNARLNPSMKGVITVGRDTSLSEFLQALWRFRGLDSGQSVRIVITQEDEQVIRKVVEEHTGNSIEEVGLEEVLLYTILEQAKKLGANNVLAFTQKKDAILRQVVLQGLLNAPAEKMPEIYDACRGVFESTQNTRPYQSSLPEEILTKEAFVDREISQFLKADLLHECLASVEEFVDAKKDLGSDTEISLLNYVEKELQALKERELPRLPDEIVTGEDAGQESFVQTQSQQNTNQQQTTTTTTQQQTTPISAIFKDLSLSKEETWRFVGLLKKEYFTEQPDRALSIDRVLKEGMEEYVGVFDSRILCSSNLCPLDSSGYKPLPMFSKFQANFNKALLIENEETSELQMLLLDARDEKQFQALLTRVTKSSEIQKSKETSGNRLAIVDFYTGICQQSDVDHPISAKRLQANAVFQKLKVQGKFRTGEINYSAEEKPYLEAWIQEVGADKLKKLFLEEIFPRTSILPEEKGMKRFQESVLGKLLSKG